MFLFCTRDHSTAMTILPTTLVQFLLTILGIGLGLEVQVVLDHSHGHVEPEFISVTIDSNKLRPPKWRTFSLSSPRVQSLLKGLSPAYLRLGGTSADYLIFKNEAVDASRKIDKATPVLNTTDVDDIVKLVRKVNYKFLMDLNLQLRNGSRWNPTNAASLLDYINKMKYHDVFNFELGNEPDSYHKHKPEFVTISGTQIGKDFLSLYNLLKRYNFTSFTFVGPDFGNVVEAADLFKDFLQEAGQVLTAATYHHYYFNGKTANVSDFVEANHFDKYKSLVRTAKGIIKKSGTPSLPLWLGETADAYNSGTRNVSDRYVSGFLWLDKLGVSAHESMGVVMRQCFYGGNYALTDLNNMPNPDYWLSYLHKQLVGTIVLNVYTKETFDSTLYWESLWNKPHKPEATTTSEVRVYAHCTKERRYKKGAVTVFALSVKKSGSEKLLFPAPLSDQTVDVYMLTPVGPEGLTSKLVALNGKTLQLIDDHTLPPLVPVQQQASHGIELPALTFGFFVFPNANASACK